MLCSRSAKHRIPHGVFQEVHTVRNRPESSPAMRPRTPSPPFEASSEFSFLPDAEKRESFEINSFVRRFLLDLFPVQKFPNGGDHIRGRSAVGGVDDNLSQHSIDDLVGIALPAGPAVAAR